MKLQDFNTLAEAQAYTTSGEGRMITPDTMLSYVTAFNLVDPLLYNPTTNEAKGVKVAFQFGSDFNLINGHPKNVGGLLDILITDGIVPQAFKDALVAYSNPVKTPFASATQEEFDRVKNEIELEAYKVVYVNGQNGQPDDKDNYHVKGGKNKGIKVTITLDTPSTYDEYFEVEVLERVDGIWDTKGQVIANVMVPAGETQVTSIPIFKPFGAIVKFNSKNKFNQPHKLSITQAER